MGDPVGRRHHDLPRMSFEPLGFAEKASFDHADDVIDSECPG
jgi:hypothetical protein